MADLRLEANQQWPVRLFRKSVSKQRKYRQITDFLGSSEHCRCLDIGGDNGVISYLLRQRGGWWKSADLEENSVRAIRQLVAREVYQIGNRLEPFQDEEFDRVVIIDYLEHIPDDRTFIQEVYRVLKPGGELIVNVPHLKKSWLIALRDFLGQTDEKHGHLRPGYSLEGLQALLDGRFQLQAARTYSKTFSELVDILIVFAVSVLKKDGGGPSKKGLIVTGADLSSYGSSFKLYAMVYPFVWLFTQLDALLFFQSGYRMIVKAKVIKE